jgi:diguanylate cyclase (GGDEF)-like protein
VVKKRQIAFGHLLGKVLPVELLPLADQAEIRKAIAAGDQTRIEELTRRALHAFVGLGIFRKTGEEYEGTERVARFRDLRTGNAVTIREPVGPDLESIRRIPLPLRGTRTGGNVDQVRSLLSLERKLITKDNLLITSVPAILQLILDTARDLTGADEVTFSLSAPRSSAHVLGEEIPQAPPFDPPLTEDLVHSQNLLVAIPDIAAHPAPGARAGARSVAILRLGEERAGLVGAVHAWSRTPGFWNEDRLTLLALLAEAGTDLLRRSEILNRLVFVDSGTQVYNRTYFNVQLANEIARARRDRKSIALCIVDIDNFKSYNSRFGYEGGNEVLLNAARVLKVGLRVFDLVARWGGEEFALILTSPVTLEEAEAIAERLRRAIELSRFSILGLGGELENAGITVSIGAALHPDDAADAESLWRSANTALKWAKEHGKNRVTFFGRMGKRERGGKSA